MAREKRFDILGRGGKTGQVERKATDERGAIGLGGGRESFADQPRTYKGVDGVGKP